MRKTINKLTIVVVATFMMIGFTNTSNAQVFEKDKSFVSLGYGIGTYASLEVFNNYYDETDYDYSEIGPLFFKYEYAFDDNFGLSANVAYVSGKEEWTRLGSDGDGNTIIRKYYSKSSGISILGRFNWHIGDHDKLDPYLGAGIGYKTSSIDYTTLEPFFLGHEKLRYNVGVELTFGTRYFFSENIGAYFEVGVAKALIQFGLTAKF